MQRYYSCYRLALDARPSFEEALALSKAVDGSAAGYVSLEDFVLFFQTKCLGDALFALRGSAARSSLFFYDFRSATLAKVIIPSAPFHMC